MRDILVGVDGSAAAQGALDRALRLGQLTGRAVRVLHAWDQPVPLATSLGTGYVYDAVAGAENARDQALALLDREVSSGLARLTSDRPVQVKAVEVAGPAGAALVEAAEDAACVVVGTRIRGRAATLLGTAAPHVLHHAACPVLVVPEEAHGGARFHRVVVGIDGSDSSRSALRWAAELAGRDGAELVAVHAEGHTKVALQDAPGGWDEEVGACLKDVPHGPVSVRVSKRRAAQTLLAEAGGDDLLVLGSRGTGAITGLVLGSVSAHCVAHARTPVVVVRAGEERLDDLFEESSPARSAAS